MDTAYIFHETDIGQCLDCGWSGRWCDKLKSCFRCGSLLERVESYEAGEAAYIEHKRTEREFESLAG